MWSSVDKTVQKKGWTNLTFKGVGGTWTRQLEVRQGGTAAAPAQIVDSAYRRYNVRTGSNEYLATQMERGAQGAAQADFISRNSIFIERTSGEQWTVMTVPGIDHGTPSMPSKPVAFQFFATASDIDSGIERIEAEFNFKYIRAGYFDTGPIHVFESALSVPDLGSCADWWFPFCDHYLILPEDEEIQVDTIELDAGGRRGRISADNYPTTIMIQFGGLYGEQRLIGGSCLCNSDVPDVTSMRDEYYTHITTGFTEMRAPSGSIWRVGPEALEMVKSGKVLQTDDTYPEVLSVEGILQ